jgi:hypothetical protein
VNCCRRMRELRFRALVLASAVGTACRPQTAAMPEPPTLVWEGAVNHASAPLAVTVELRSDSAGASVGRVRG